MDENVTKTCAPNIWLTADLHLTHPNIVKYSPKRGEVGGFDVDDVEAHDEWLINMWNSKVKKSDIVYVVGDFCFGSTEHIRTKILPRLNGNIFMVEGNHDKNSKPIKHLFAGYSQMKELRFRHENYPFIEEDNFRLFLCHYPMLEWNARHYGVVQVMGHCHGKLDELNEESPELRVDVGIDGKLANHSLVSLEQLYRHFKAKTKGKPFDVYCKENNILHH